MVVDYPRWLWRPILAKILRTRPARVAEQYRAIWTDEGSPLETGTRRICDGLAEKLESEVRFVYRYGSPSLREALAFSGELRIVPLFPQRTGATTGTIEALVRDAGVTDPIRQIAPDDPGYIEALADGFLRAVGARAPEHLVMSFHGIPVRYDRKEGRRYRRDCETTHRALLSRLGWDGGRATLSYQSRFWTRAMGRSEHRGRARSAPTERCKESCGDDTRVRHRWTRDIGGARYSRKEGFRGGRWRAFRARPLRREPSRFRRGPRRSRFRLTWNIDLSTATPSKSSSRNTTGRGLAIRATPPPSSSRMKWAKMSTSNAWPRPTVSARTRLCRFTGIFRFVTSSVCFAAVTSSSARITSAPRPISS